MTRRSQEEQRRQHQEQEERLEAAREALQADLQATERFIASIPEPPEPSLGELLRARAKTGKEK